MQPAERQADSAASGEADRSLSDRRGMLLCWKRLSLSGCAARFHIDAYLFTASKQRHTQTQQHQAWTARLPTCYVTYKTVMRTRRPDYCTERTLKSSLSLRLTASHVVWVRAALSTANALHATNLTHSEICSASLAHTMLRFKYSWESRTLRLFRMRRYTAESHFSTQILSIPCALKQQCVVLANIGAGSYASV